MAKILISGGTGLLGKRLIPKLIDLGHEIVLLSRSEGQMSIHGQSIPKYKWNIKTQEIDDKAFDGIDYMIHLAGKNVNVRWSKKNKEEIVNSRTQSAKLLIDKIEELKIPLKKFISAGGISIYGETYGKAMNETQDKSNDFLANVCKEWEKSVSRISSLNIPVVIFRIGVVLSNEGGAFKLMKFPFKFGFGSPLGSGEQYLPWIHIEDATNAFVHAVQEDMKGIYNLASPNPCTNSFFSKSLAKVMKVPYFMPKVPSFILRTFLGTRSWIVLAGTRASVDKILNEKFAFQFANLEDALKDLLGKK